MRIPAPAPRATREQGVHHLCRETVVLGPLGDSLAGAFEPSPCFFDSARLWHAPIPWCMVQPITTFAKRQRS